VSVGDQADGASEEGLMDVVAWFPADAQAAQAVQPASACTIRAVDSQWASATDTTTGQSPGRNMATMKTPSKKVRHGCDGVDHPHDAPVGPAAQRAGGGPDGRADHGGRQGGDAPQ
jgi:hypothetical protein